MVDLTECFAADAGELAQLHAAAFPENEQWSADAIKDLLAQKHNRAFSIGSPLQAFILFQIIEDEAEILTIATKPEYRRRGLASLLIASVTQELNIANWLLDVAADNTGAIALYTKLGFTKDGARPKYYRRKNAENVDAMLMSLRLGGQG